MQRVLRGTKWTIQNVFYSSETATDADAGVTIEVVRDNGEVLIPAGTATQAGTAGDGKYSYTLTPTELDRVDILTARWTGTFSGVAITLETQVEVVGAFYFTLAEGRASDADLTSPTKYSTAHLAEARDECEDECEFHTNVAWVPRYRRFRLSGDGSSAIAVPAQMLRAVLFCTIDDVALTEDELADIVVTEGGIVHRKSGSFTAGLENVDIGVEHGYSRPPSDVRRASLIRFRSKLFANKSGIPDRATSFSSGEGGTYSLATPGKGGSITGIPDVDVVYNDRRHYSLA